MFVSSGVRGSVVLGSVPQIRPVSESLGRVLGYARRSESGAELRESSDRPEPGTDNSLDTSRSIGSDLEPVPHAY